MSTDGLTPIDYRVKRSKRKTLELSVSSQDVLVKAPLDVSEQEIDRFVRQHRGWIEKAQKQQEEKRRESEGIDKLSAQELQELGHKATQVIPDRVAFYASQLGVNYTQITIRNQRTRWGSCSAKGHLSFNCLLMLAPPEVLDCVIVHELCHLKEMNHSQRFYDEVLRVYPEYWTWHKWLKDKGGALIQRMIKY